MFSLPDIRVEAGLVSDDPIQVSTSLILDDATLGKLDTGTLGTSITWTDISEWVRSFSITRPVDRDKGPLLTFQPGTCSVVLDNSDGRFDPDNLLDGPYVSDGVSQIDVMVPIRVLVNFGSTVYELYSGFADSWTPSTIAGYTDYAEITVASSDAFKILSNVVLPPSSTVGAGEDAGARIRRILSEIDWYTDGERNTIDTGISPLQATTLGDNALALMQLATDSELGQLFIGGKGDVVFKSRHAILTNDASSTVQAVFGDLPGTSHDDGTELNVSAINRTLDDATMANDVQATREGGTMQEVTDDTSIAKYLFKRTYSKDGLIVEGDTDALNWAQWVLYVSKNPENRFDSIEVNPFADQDNLWPQVLGRTFIDRIQVWHRPPGVTDPITKDAFIVGIQHDCDVVNVAWTTTWTLQSADKYGSFFVLDDDILGKLDNNALAF